MTPPLRSLALLAALAVVPLLAPSPAAAAGPFAPPQATCATEVAAVADGTVYGAGSCGGGVSVLVRRPGGSWRSTGVAWRDKRVEAVAADETATFVVVSCTMDQPGCGAADPLGKLFLIGKVPHGGRPSALTDLGGTEFSNDVASVAARGGRWWAVVGSTVKDRDVEGSGSQELYFRTTFGGAGAGQVPVPVQPGRRTSAYQPSIALTASGAVVAFVTQVEDPDADPVLQLATAGADGRFTTSPYGPAAGAPAAAPDVVVSGGRTFVAWSRRGRPALGLGQGDAARRVDLPARGAVGQVSVAASGGLVTVSTSETFAHRDGLTTRVYARSLGSTGALLGTTELTAVAGRRDPQVSAGLTDSTAARGRATVAFSTAEAASTSTQS